MSFVHSQLFVCLQSLLTGSALLMSAQLNAGRPAFVERPLGPSYSSTLLSVESTLAADVVFLDGGLRDGLQPGVLCQVSRGQHPLGQIIIIEASSTRSAALITSKAHHSTLQAGDSARVHTIKNG